MLPFLSIGRLIYVKDGETDWGWGIVVNFTKKKMNMKKKKQQDIAPEETFIVDTLVHIQKRKKNEDPQPASYQSEGDMEVLTLIIDTITDVSSVRINLPDEITKQENKILIKETMLEVVCLCNILNFRSSKVSILICH